MAKSVIHPVAAQDTRPPEWLSPIEVCQLIPGMTTSRLKMARFNGTGPRYSTPTPRTIVYSLESIREWLDATSRTSTAEAS